MVSKVVHTHTHTTQNQMDSDCLIIWNHLYKYPVGNWTYFRNGQNPGLVLFVFSFSFSPLLKVFSSCKFASRLSFSVSWRIHTTKLGDILSLKFKPHSSMTEFTKLPPQWGSFAVKGESSSRVWWHCLLTHPTYSNLSFILIWPSEIFFFYSLRFLRFSNHYWLIIKLLYSTTKSFLTVS